MRAARRATQPHRRPPQPRSRLRARVDQRGVTLSFFVLLETGTGPIPRAPQDGRSRLSRDAYAPLNDRLKLLGRARLPPTERRTFAPFERPVRVSWSAVAACSRGNVAATGSERIPSASAAASSARRAPSG